MATVIQPRWKWREPKPAGGGSGKGSNMNPSTLAFGHPAIKSGPKKRHPRVPRGMPGTPMGKRITHGLTQ